MADGRRAGHDGGHDQDRRGEADGLALAEAVHGGGVDKLLRESPLQPVPRRDLQFYELPGSAATPGCPDGGGTLEGRSRRKPPALPTAPSEHVAGRWPRRELHSKLPRPSARNGRSSPVTAELVGIRTIATACPATRSSPRRGLAGASEPQFG